VIDLPWTDLGRIDYARAVAVQEALRDRVLRGDDSAETLLFCEHDPVITLGRGADPAHVLAEVAPIVRSTRGGDVTAHGPGQLVIYPVVRMARGVVAFVEAIGGAIAAELGARGVSAAFRRAPAGVWVGADGAARKIAACGLHIRRRVAMHGFALNLTDEILPLFAAIVPCGLAGARVTSLARETALPPARAELCDSLASRIAHALGRSPQRAREFLP
jgi:lipoate-protein ligase B